MRTDRSRGVTLIELMVTVVVASIVMIGISSAFIAMARNYQATAGRRDAQADSRLSVSFMEDRIRQAGYGVDPHLAIEAWDSFDPNANTLAGDLSFPDAIAVYERDLTFQRDLGPGTGPGQLELVTALTERMEKGQVLLALCPNASKWAFVINGARAEAGSMGLTLANGAPAVATAVPTAGADDRYQQSAQLGDPCFRSAGAKVVKVDRYAFYLASFDDDRNPNSPRVPYLMMHSGLDVNGDGSIDANDATPVAAGVEQLQVAYVMNAPAGTVPPLWGVTAANRVKSISTWDNVGTRPLLYSAANQTLLLQQSVSNAGLGGDSRRIFTDNPGNIRQVRVTLVARSKLPNEALQGDNLFDNSAAAAAWNTQVLSNGTTAWNQLENLQNPPNPDFNPVGGGYLRRVMRMSISTKNLMMPRQFPPGVYGG